MIKVFYVVYSFGDYDYEHTRVYASSKKEVRAIMKREVGSNVRIIDIEVEDE